MHIIPNLPERASRQRVPSNGATWGGRVTWDKRGWSTYVMNFEITIQLI